MTDDCECIVCKVRAVLPADEDMTKETLLDAIDAVSCVLAALLCQADDDGAKYFTDYVLSVRASLMADEHAHPVTH